MTRPFREARIDVNAIAHNTERMRRAAPTPHFMAVVKADGYGHGAAAVARAALSAGATRLGDVKRYLQGCELRLEKLRADPARDARWTAEIAPVEAEYRGLLAALPEHTPPSPALPSSTWRTSE